MKEREENQEKAPEHNKKTKIYFMVMMAALTLSLIYSGFSGGSKEEKETVKQLPDPKGTIPSSHSQDLFDGVVTQSKTGKAYTAGNSDHHSQNNRPNDHKRDSDTEWKKQERTRALAARMSKFDLQIQSESKQPTPQKAIFSNEISQIEDQLGFIEKEYGQTLQKIEKGGDYLSHFGGANPPKEEIVIGKPLSEQAPKKGQKKIATTTVISAVLDQDLTSDYIGTYRGLIAKDVYDATGNYILIPKGSRFIGKSLRITNVNAPIQARMGLTVDAVILRGGKRISFKKTSALDRSGVHGIKDKVNHHFMAQFLGVAAYALISSESSREGSGFANDKTFEGEFGQGVRDQFSNVANKYLSLVPTITLGAGTPMRIFIEDDIYVDVWKKTYNTFFKGN